MTPSTEAPTDPAAALERFSPVVRDWFTGSFPEPTTAQAGAWDAIGRGEHTLVVAPTGSGKTLSAFLSAIDDLVTAPVPDKAEQRCRVLYLSPIKALAVDVERNLRSPLTGIAQVAAREGLSLPPVSVAVRSGDTPSGDRRSFARDGADILITTPESLFLLLTSRAREMLSGVETVILDEVHAVAGTKRGAHLAVSLDRLDLLLDRPAQRIGLSATVRPLEEVSRYLTGGRPVTVVKPPISKQIDVDVVVPVADMADLGTPTGDLTGPAAGDPARTSIWPHVEERVVDLIEQHRSTIVFANSRRLAERLTARLNEIHAERRSQVELGAEPAPASRSVPAQVMAQAGATAGAEAVLARAHHGSVSREQRALIEEELKSGRLPAVVATSSLELGIDMGAVDLVIQVESPPSVSSGLQRIGRAGHQVGVPSHGVMFPKYRGDLVSAAVVAGRMRTGAIEALTVPSNPLDVLAQQIVAICAMDPITVDELHELVRRSAPFGGLGRVALEAVLDMLSGRYPSEQFAELRPRLTWDRVTGELTGRPGAQRLAVTSGGTIPDRGLFGVFLAAGGDEAAGTGRRVGELDEEMVYESRVGDVFALGSSSWRILEITHDRVLVVPAPGQPGRLPFWKGDSLGRPAELGRAHGEFIRDLLAHSHHDSYERLRGEGLDEFAAANLLSYLHEQREATQQVPDEKTLLVERFRDELGDWRIIVHSPWGAGVHAPWSLIVAARMRERFGVDVQAMHADDGIVLRLPDLDGTEDGNPPDISDLLVLDPDSIEAEVTEQVGGSAVFASRFRECAGRALLLPRRQIGKRQPLWQQRQRAASLLEVAAQYPSFPIVAEAVREVLSEVFDVPALVAVMRGVANRSVQLIEVTTRQPSPFARSLMFGYVAQFLYEGDSPLAERRAAALSVDPVLLAELLGHGDGLALRDLLDPVALAGVEADLQRLSEQRRARTVDDLADLLRILGPLTDEEIAARSDLADPAAAMAELVATRRAIGVRIAGVPRWADPTDAPLLRDALGTALPPGIAETLLEPVPDPLGRLLSRYARTHGPFVPAQPAALFGLGTAVVVDALRRLLGTGRLAEGEFRPLGSTTAPGGIAAAEGVREFVDAEVLRLLRRRSLAALRAEVEPVPPSAFGAFLPEWNAVGGRNRLRGTDGLVRAVEQLAGAVVPASAVESLILPARVADYRPGLLDELLSAGEVLWSGHGALAGDDCWVSLHLADTASLTLRLPDPVPDNDQPADKDVFTGSRAEQVGGVWHHRVLDLFNRGGAFLFRDLSDAVGRAALADEDALTDDDTLTEVLWDLSFAGLVTADSFAAVRARLAGGKTTHKAKRSAPAPKRRSMSGLSMLAANRSRVGPAVRRTGPPTAAGRWSILPVAETDATVRAHAQAEVLLDRYGVVTRGSVAAEQISGGFAGVYRVLAAFEEAGRTRRGYFVEGLGAAQFGTAGAVDRLRGFVQGPDTEPPLQAVVLAAADPANPYGAALPWPAPPGAAAVGGGQTDPGPATNGAGSPASRGTLHRPARRAGAVVALVDGAPVLFAERGGRTVLSFTEDPAALVAAAAALVERVHSGAINGLTVTKVDGTDALVVGGPVAAALVEAGFAQTPRGLRVRTRVTTP